MLHPKTILRRTPARRIAGNRRASVLILVVALLVLMALIATALIGNVRGDRYTAVQNTNNTQVDLLLEGVKNMTLAKIVDDLYNKSAAAGDVSYRAETAGGTYGAFDGLEVNVAETDGTFAAANDGWLASRYPQVATWLSPTTPGYIAPTAGGAANSVSWGAITNPIIGSTFESPIPVAANTRYTARAHVQPTSILSAAGQTLPALVRGDFLLSPEAAGWAPQAAIPAADADGDGIADAGWVKLPVGEINGLQYYAGVRIIDNAGAINLNTAWTARHEFDFAGADAPVPTPDPIGLFRANVGLAEFLRSWTGGAVANPVAVQNGMYNPALGLGAEIDALNLYRWTGAVAALPPGKQAPAYDPPANVRDTPTGIDGEAARPVRADRDPAGNPAVTRADFTFVNIGDAVENQLARRIDYPGYGSGQTGNEQRLRSFAVSDQLSLAYHFSCSNTYTDVSPSPLELLLDNVSGGQQTSSLYNRLEPPLPVGTGTRTPLRKAYDVSNAGVSQWFQQHFDFSEEILADTAGGVNQPATFKNRRTQLTLLSRTSNFTSPRTTTGTSAPPAGVGMREYPPYNAGTVTHRPGAQAVATRTSINTAAFNELWRAYWSVMTEPGGAAPYNNGIDPVPTGQPEGSTVAGMPAAYKQPHIDSRAAAPTVAHDYTRLYTGSTFPMPPVSVAPAAPATEQAAVAFAQDRTATPNPQNVMRMFRSSLRDNRTATVTAANTALRFTPDNQILLRSAIAANNADWMRYPDQRDPLTNSSARRPNPGNGTISFNAEEAGGAIVTHVDIFPIGPQPFITEVLASGDQGTYAGLTNPNGYLAIELYNPYPDPIVLDDTYKIVIIDRRPGAAFNPGGGAGSGRSMKILASFPAAGVTIPSNDYFVIDSLDPASATEYRPLTVTTPLTPLATPIPQTGAMPAARGISFPQLLSAADPDKAFDNEVQLVRVDPALRGLNIAAGPATEIGTRVEPVMPLDGFDLTGFTGAAVLSLTDPQLWHYVRASATGTGTGYLGRWTCVYPGRYDGSLPARRQQGTQAFTYTVGGAEPTITWPSADLTPGFGLPSAESSYQTLIPIQLLNVGNAGTDNPITAGGNNFPFGGFARNGDILQVPFISAYRVRDLNGNLLEMNPVTMDASFAEDTDPVDEAQDPFGGISEATEMRTWRESVGRFVPIIDDESSGSNMFITDSRPSNTGGPNTNMNRDEVSDTVGPGLEWMHRYAWSTKLFDYLTVQNPHDDYLPNASPIIYNTLNPGTPVEPARNSYGPPATEATYGTITAANSRGIEDQVPIEGLINLNTASWRILATLPWMPPGSNRNTALEAGSTMTDNEFIAKSIVQYRDGVRLLPAAMFPVFPVGASADDAANGPPGGPFRSIYDIYRIKQIRLLAAQAYDRPASIDPNTGDLFANDDSFYDFEERTLLLNRVSNLVTVRSDAFTAYIVLEGWKNAGTAQAERVVQRRAAFLVDRSGVTPTNPKVKTINIPVE